MIHRISGLSLAIFLPIHLLVLAQLLHAPGHVELFLSWTQTPVAKILETGLVALAAVHLAGGVRIVVYEWMTTELRHGLWLAAGVGFAFLFAVLFLINAL